jgi:hypothetical protein
VHEVVLTVDAKERRAEVAGPTHEIRRLKAALKRGAITYRPRR